MPLQGFLAFKSSLFTLSTTAAAAAIKDPYKDTAYSKTRGRGLGEKKLASAVAKSRL